MKPFTSLTPSQKRYVAREAVIGAAISAVISAFFVWIVFGGAAEIPRRQLLLDAVPQSFMLAFMVVLVPTVLTRRRIAAGRVAPSEVRTIRLPANLALRALLVAVSAAVIGMAVTAAALTLLDAERLAFGTAMLLKSLYGFMLGLVVATLAAWTSLADVRAAR